jgi:hypothetical protein
VPSATNLLDVYLAALRFNWGGIGIYPEWSYDGKVVGGLHVDVRHMVLKGFNSSWLGVGNPLTYKPVNHVTLKQYGVI